MTETRKPRWWAKLSLFIAARYFDLAKAQFDLDSANAKIVEIESKNKALRKSIFELRQSRESEINEKEKVRVEHELALVKAQAEADALRIQVEFLNEIIERDRARVQSEHAAYDSAKRLSEKSASFGG